MKDYIVGIDLGSSSIVVAVGRRADDGKIIVESVIAHESKGVTRGEVKNVEQAAQSIREALDEVENQLGIRVERAYAGISGSHIKCARHPYYVYVSGEDTEIVEQDVRHLNESMRVARVPSGYKLMHIIPQHYIIDSSEEVANPVGRFGNTLGSNFNLIVGDTVILSRMEKAIHKAGIESAGFYVNPLAMSEAVAFPDEKEIGVAVVDMGAGTTDLTIYKDGIMRYMSIIPLGSDSVNKDIRSYGIMERYVEELKVTYGCAMASLVADEKLVRVPGRTPNDSKEISFRTLASIIEARLLDIVDYIVAEIKESGYEGKLQAGIVLTGGGSLIKEIAALVESRTKMEVRIAAADLKVDAQSRETVADPRYSAAVGVLAMAVELSAEGSDGMVCAKSVDIEPAEEVEPQDDFGGQTEEEEDFEREEPSRGWWPWGRKKSRRRRDDEDDEQDDLSGEEPRRRSIDRIKEKFDSTFGMEVLDEDTEI